MKAILHNKEDDLHFLLKCLVDEIDEGLLLKKKDEKTTVQKIKESIKEMKTEKKVLDSSLKNAEGKEKTQIQNKIDKIESSIESAKESLAFAQEDKKLEAAREKDEETAAQTEKELASHIKNTMGEKVADKDEENKMVEAYNKMYSAFLNYVKDRFSDKEVIERYEGTEEQKGRIQLLQDELDRKTPLREGSRKTPLTDAQKENYRRQIEGMKQEVANAKKNIADKKAREEKALKDIRDGKDLVIDLGSESQFKPLTIPNADVVRALNEYKKTTKVKVEAKLSSLQRMGMKDDERIRTKRATILEGLDKLASNPTKRLRELLGDEKVKRALGDTFEIGDKGIEETLYELRADGTKKKQPTVLLQAYDRALGLIQTELKNLKRLKTKTTTKNKIEELENKVKKLQGLYNTFRDIRNNVREDKGDRSVTPMSTTKTYYNDLKKAIEDFRASVNQNKDNSNRIKIAAKKYLDSTNLGDFQTVLAVINVMKGSVVRADKVQEAEKRKAKLKTEIEGLKGQGRKTSRRNKLIQEFESTIREIQELHQLKDIKEGKIEEAKTPQQLADSAFEQEITRNIPALKKVLSEKEKELNKVTNGKTIKQNEKILENLKEKLSEENNKDKKDREIIEPILSDIKKIKNIISLTSQIKRLKRQISSKSPKAKIRKQDIVDAFLRYDINKNKKLVLRDIPFDEESKDYATIKKTIDEILQLLQKEVKGFDANLETVIKASFDYNEPDLSKEGKKNRKKLRERLEANRKSLRAKRAGKEQIKATIPANLIKQLADVEDDISDLVIEYLTKMFPDFTLSLKIPTFNVFPVVVYTKESVKLREKEVKEYTEKGVEREDMKFSPLVKEKIGSPRVIEARVEIFSKGGETNKTKDNYVKSLLSEHFRIFPTLIDEKDKRKPNSLAVQEMWEGLMDDLNTLVKVPITKKEKEDTKKFLEEYDKDLENKFKAFKGAKTDLLKFFEAITKFAEDYEKLADEYDKVVAQIKGGKAKTGKTLEKELRNKWDSWMKTNEGKELPLNFMGVKIKDSDLKSKTTTKPIKEDVEEQVETEPEKEKTPLDLFIERMSRTLEIIREYYTKARKVDESQRPTKEEVTTLENDIMSTIEQTNPFSESKRIQQYSKRYGRNVGRYKQDEDNKIFLTKDERENIVDGLVHLKKTIGLPTQSEKNVDNLVDLEQAYENALDRLSTKETEESTIKPSIEQKGTPPSKDELQAWFDNWLERELKFSNKKDLKGDKKNLQSKAKELEERLVGLLEVFFVNIKKSSIVDFKNKLKIQDYKRNPQSLRRILLTKTVSDSKVFDNVADLESLMKQFMGLDEKLKKEMDLSRVLAEVDKIEILADFAEWGEKFSEETNALEREILEEIREEKEEGK